MVEIKAFLFGVTRAIKEAPQRVLRGSNRGAGMK